MVLENIFFGFPVWAIVIFVIIAIWDLCWKGVGLWKAGQNHHLAWFVAILVLNTVGILPMIYIGWFDKKNILDKKLISKKK